MSLLRETLAEERLQFDPINGDPLPADNSARPADYRLRGLVWKFNPWTGCARDPLDVKSDPHGLTILPPGALLRPHFPKPVIYSKLLEGAPALNGGKLKGDHYYRVTVAEPISPEVQPYTAECADIIEALGMTFNEGEAFKALWRLAAARRGRAKPGTVPQYDADKVAHYGARVAAQTKREGKAHEPR